LTANIGFPVDIIGRTDILSPSNAQMEREVQTSPNLARLPEHMHGAIARYIERGIPPGSFLEAVLSNDLKGAVGRADHINRERIGDYVRFLYNDAPAGCWGSPEAVSDWIKAGGLLGRERASEQSAA
jgi:hypothetical protein